MTGINLLKLILILIIISQILFFNFISSNNFYQAFIYIPIYFIYGIVYIVYNEIDIEYIIIPIILGTTLISLLLFYQLEHNYYLCHGDSGETDKSMIYKSILFLIAILYIFQNKKCNLSKVAMVFLLITFIQAYMHMYSDEKKQENITNDIENEKNEDKKDDDKKDDDKKNEEDNEED
jgi:hypothetical protein